MSSSEEFLAKRRKFANGCIDTPFVDVPEKLASEHRADFEALYQDILDLQQRLQNKYGASHASENAHFYSMHHTAFIQHMEAAKNHSCMCVLASVCAIRNDDGSSSASAGKDESGTTATGKQ